MRPFAHCLPGFRVRDEDVSRTGHCLAFADASGGLDRAMSSPIPAAAMTRRRNTCEGMADFEQLAPIGTGTSPTTMPRFCVAGRIIEVLTGATYEDALRELIFEPLGMARSFLMPDAR